MKPDSFHKPQHGMQQKSILYRNIFTKYLEMAAGKFAMVGSFVIASVAKPSSNPGSRAFQPWIASLRPQ
ncbi:hypothetical protein C5L14_04180 [Labrys okinawensis]|uniref:Uncharacterized protein n=1 Tax=Labrys okinawensis TaxID=346911 RepID=A0A2S9QGN0_9HYPH|nr:hypothetical protein [Labrys okinawensis]PRH88450.1 hypothetical protein C5L14_04180 [Labrys okinawensis]